MGEEEEELPFDISGDEIHLEDDDYGVWFIDAMERPELYDGKTMVMKTRVFKAMRMPKGTFVPGRHAMTCCADDIQFIGYLAIQTMRSPLQLNLLRIRCGLHLPQK
ncbi:MAG: hypothetical protein ACLTS6_13175 [Anaerobutyricum sp.]